MNFEPDNILTPRYGNNANARSVNVRVMNDEQPTTAQLQYLAKAFHLHKLNVVTSLAGYLVRNGRLPDGSPFRIVSNSGQHTLMLWPVGGGEGGSVFDWFHAVPTSDSALSGALGALPSRTWKLPGKLEHWPDQLKPKNDLPDHPGHVTWYNKNLKYGGKPIVVSWRGPRDRYAATTGFNDGAGSGSTPHERSPYAYPTPTPLANNLLLDSRYVWIDAHRVDTGRSKIVAACLHEYDPAEARGKFVLRVICDENDSGGRQFTTYDLVPAAGVAGAGLKSFAEARGTMSVKASYAAGHGTPQANINGTSSTPGDWDYWQRPHFNRSGTRVATIICKVGANGTDREMHAVSFNPTTWVADVDVAAHRTAAGTADFGVAGFGPDRPYTGVLHASTETFVAADFEGDTFVYVKHTAVQDVTESGIFIPAGPAFGGSLFDGEKHRNEVWTCTLTHSRLGELSASTSTSAYDYAFSVSSPSGSISYTITGGFRELSPGTGGPYVAPHFAFVGDLRCASFAVGYWPAGIAAYSASGTLDDTVHLSATMSATRTVPRLVFDVWYDGVKRETATTGGFPAVAPLTEVAAYPDTFGALSVVQPGTILAAVADDNTGSGTARYGAIAFPAYPPSKEGPSTNFGADYRLGTAPVFQHCAIIPDLRAGYIGAAYFETNYGTSPVVSGMELVFVKAADGTVTVANPPTYATGAHPTMSAPVFSGPAAEAAK